METWRVSSSEALRRRLHAADETPQGIMALGAFLDTFISNGGCSTDRAECRPNHQHTLTWDDATLDTMEASEESSNSRSSRHRSTSPSSQGTIQQVSGFLKQRKSAEESSFPTRNRTRSEEKSGSRTVGSELLSTDLLSISFDQLQSSFSLQQAYAQSIFQNSTMESAEKSVKAEGSTTKSRSQPLRRQSTPSSSKARYSSLADTSQSQRSFRRNSTPKPVGKKSRLVSPDSTPKAHNSQRRSSSSSPFRTRPLWSSPRKSKDPRKEDDSLRESSSRVRSSWRRQARLGSVVDGRTVWDCPDTQPSTSFRYFDFPNLFCGQGLAWEPSINRPSKVPLTTTFSQHDPDMNDLIMDTSPPQTTGSAESILSTEGATRADAYSQSLFSMEQPLDDSDVLANPSVEQTLEVIALEKKKNLFKSIFRTTNGSRGKFSIEIKPKGSRLETPPIQTSATHDTDLLAKASLEQSLEESNVFGVVPKDNIPVTNERTPSQQDNDQSNGNKSVHEIEITTFVEGAPVPVNNDRVGDLEQQVQDLMSRIRQLEHGIKETVNHGDENGHGNDVMNTADNMKIQADDMQVGQTADPQLEEQAIENQSSPDGLVEEMHQPMMSPVVPREEMLATEQVSGAGNDAEATTTGSTKEDPGSTVQEVSVCSAVEKNRTDEDCAEDDGIEVDISDFVCKTDRITGDKDMSTIVSMEQEIEQGDEGNDEEDEGIEISMNGLEHSLNSNDTEQADQISIQNIANELAESSNEDRIEKKEKNKKRNVVRGLKKKLLRVTGPRISKSRIKSTMEGQEVMPLTGVYGVQVGSQISAVSSLVSSEGERTVEQPRDRYGMREKSCEVSLATGTTTLPTSNVLTSINI